MDSSLVLGVVAVKWKMSYSALSPKNQICSYGAHFATAAEKHRSVV